MNYKNSAAFKLRRWIVSELNDSDVLYMDRYNGIEPLVPVQDVDEVSERLGSLPYMYYYSMPLPRTNKDALYMREELLSITILANNYTEISGLSNFLIDLMDRSDMSARDANKKVDDDSIAFQTIDFRESSEVFKADQPASRYVMEMVFCYKYVKSIGSDGRYL